MVDGGPEVDRGTDGVGEVEAPLRPGFENLEERRSLEVLEQDEGQPVVLGAAEAADDVRVPGGAEDACFPAQRRGARPVAAPLWREDLAGEGAPLARAPDLVQVAEPTGREVADDGEVAGDAVTSRVRVGSVGRTGFVGFAGVPQPEVAGRRRLRAAHLAAVEARSSRTLPRISLRCAGFAM